MAPVPKKLDSGAYRVRWRDPTGKRKQRQFQTKALADRWCAEITVRRQTGGMDALVPSRLTLDELATEWLAGPGSELAPRSRNTYTAVIRKHIIQRIGRYPVGLIDKRVVREWMAAMQRDGVTPDPRARALKYLRMLLNYAVEHDYIASNPAQSVKMPKIPASDPVAAISPRQGEQLRSKIEDQGRQADSILVAIELYAGLRPGEATALRWRNVRERTILVRSTKTNRVDAVQMFEPLVEELREWRMACGRPSDNALVVPPPQALAWSDTTRSNWRTRVFDPAAMAVGFVETRVDRRGKTYEASSITPYTLRHSFGSLLVHAGYPLTYVAQQMRHSLEMTMRHYAHLIADMDPKKTIDPVAAIREAQGERRGHLTATG